MRTHANINRCSPPGRTLRAGIRTAVVLLLGACSAGQQAAPSPLEQARQRLAEHPQDPATYLKLATLSLERQDVLRAGQYLALAERSVAAGQGAHGIDPEALFELGITIAVRAQNYSEAIRRCLARLDASEAGSVRRLLAVLYEAHGELREAERQHLLLLKLHPDAVEDLAAAARFYERSGLSDRLDRARELYQRYLAAAPNGESARQVRAALQINMFDSQNR